MEMIEKIQYTKNGKQFIELAALRKEEALFWNIIAGFRTWNLPYDLFLPYKSLERKSLLLQRRKIRSKNNLNTNAQTENEAPWFDQFKQIRVLALCTDKEVQTDTLPQNEPDKFKNNIQNTQI